MEKSKDSGTAAPSTGTIGAGERGHKDTPSNTPTSLPREGYVVWFPLPDLYLGYAWDTEDGEIKRANVPDGDHAIYFETFAQAMVATDQLDGACHILYSPRPGEKTRLIG